MAQQPKRGSKAGAKHTGTASTSRSTAGTGPVLCSNKRKLSPAPAPPVIQKKPRRNNAVVVPKKTCCKPAALISDDSDEIIEDSEVERDCLKERENASDDNIVTSSSEEEEEEADEELDALPSTQAASVLCSEVVQFRRTPDDKASDKANGALSMRNERYHSEVPKWTNREKTEVPSQLSLTSALSHSQQSEELTAAAANARWPVEAHYTPLQPGKRMLSVTLQPPTLRKVLRDGEYQALKLCFEESFFIMHDTEYSALTALLINIAEKSRLPQLVLRFQQDREFYRLCGGMISHRLAMHRSQIKIIAGPIVGLRFGFDELNAKAEWIKTTANTLIREFTYIFPTEDGSPVTKRPYEHPVIIQTLTKFLFTGNTRCSALADSFPEIFRSSSELPQHHDQKEIPLSVIALAATAVHNCIHDWITGVYIKTPFSLDTIEDVFNGHHEYLKSMQNTERSKYHILAHRLYNQSNTSSTVGSSIVAGISKLVDLDAMDDDM